MKGFYGKKVQHSVSTVIEGVRQVSDAREKAAIFNEYFCDKRKVDDSFASLPSNTCFQNNVTLSTIFTTEREVQDVLKAVDAAKAVWT